MSVNFFCLSTENIGDQDLNSKRNATLTVGNKKYELPVLSPSAGPDAIDIRKLYSSANLFAYDPGF
ncbi:MAG: hypothetical protein OXC53_01965, partial [Rhodobacteraceae bacterium]|nr:hypothetical protein [Paracoccaceae bacterium]